MKQLLILCVFVLLVTRVSASEVEAPHTFALAGVRFVGIKSVSKKSLTKKLLTQAPSRLKFWRPKPIITGENLQDDILRIKQFYQDHGYYHTAVVYKTEAAVSRDTGHTSQAERGIKSAASPPLMRVTFFVTEGPPVLVETIELKITPESDSLLEKDLLSAVSLKPGRILEIADYREAKKTILKASGNRGHPFAKLTGRVTVNTVKNSAKVLFALDPGTQYAFGSLSILKDDAVIKDIVILRAIRFKKGEIYSADKVDSSRRNLFNLDVFKLVVIKPEQPEPGSASVPISVQLMPKKRQNVKLGVGYGTEDGFRIKGAWTYRNLWGWAGKLSVSAKRSDLIENVQAEYIQPYFLGAQNTLLSKAGYEREKFTSYTNQKIFTNTGIERMFRKNWVGSAGYNLEVNNLQEVKITVPEELERLSDENNYFISSILAGVKYNTAENVFNPKKGTGISLSAEWASSLLGSEINYFKPAIELKRYESLADKVVLAGRVRFETLQSDEPAGIPIFKRLFLGGSNTVRGYGYQELPPLDENGKPLGGLSLFNANLEVRYPLYQKLSGVFFIDTGLLNADYLQYNSSDMRYSCGAGIRYNTIIGPLRLDLGYKLNPPTRDEIGDFSDPDKEIGDRWRIHLSIGQAF